MNIEILEKNVKKISLTANLQDFSIITGYENKVFKKRNQIHIKRSLISKPFGIKMMIFLYEIYKAIYKDGIKTRCLLKKNQNGLVIACAVRSVFDYLSEYVKDVVYEESKITGRNVTKKNNLMNLFISHIKLEESLYNLNIAAQIGNRRYKCNNLANQKRAIAKTYYNESLAIRQMLIAFINKQRLDIELNKNLGLTVLFSCSQNATIQINRFIEQRKVWLIEGMSKDWDNRDKYLKSIKIDSLTSDVLKIVYHNFKRIIPNKNQVKDIFYLACVGGTTIQKIAVAIQKNKKVSIKKYDIRDISEDIVNAFLAIEELSEKKNNAQRQSFEHVIMVEMQKIRQAYKKISQRMASVIIDYESSVEAL